MEATCFDEEYLGFLDQRKQAKKQWVQDPNKRNIHNVRNIRHEASRQFSNVKREYLEVKINEHETNSKNKNIRALCRSISDFKKG
jgi:hypothetical protein